MGKVLVVEDDPMLRFIVSESLRDGDLEVIESATGDEALECLRQTEGISVVFSDINMPGTLDGIHLAHAVQTTCPGIKIILTSGRPHVVGDIPFIAKPYVLADLLSTILASL